MSEVESPPHAPLALTMGDPRGVCAEITEKAWHALKVDGPVFFLVASEAHADGLNAPVEFIEKPADATSVFSAALPVLRLTADATGISDDLARQIISSIETAVGLAASGAARAVVTNPINKSALIGAGFRFNGHTEFIGDLVKSFPMPENRAQGAVMMIAGPELRTVPITIHEPLADVPSLLSEERISGAGRIVAEALVHDFGIDAPRLAFAGLNPHAGEDGALGREDSEIITPAIASLRSCGVDAVGPLPADTMFHADARRQYDAALCMYHDQALIPAKMLGFHDAVNVTLGLPIIRTSPDHGTAEDIAGKGVARPDSLIAAIRLASDMAEARARR